MKRKRKGENWIERERAESFLFLFNKIVPSHWSVIVPRTFLNVLRFVHQAWKMNDYALHKNNDSKDLPACLSSISWNRSTYCIKIDIFLAFCRENLCNISSWDRKNVKFQDEISEFLKRKKNETIIIIMKRRGIKKSSLKKSQALIDLIQLNVT